MANAGPFAARADDPRALFFDDRTAAGSPTSPNDPVQPGDYSNFTSLLGVGVGRAF
jgi:hypothetical protein